MRQRIEALLLQGKTYNQIVAELGCAKSTVAYHAKNIRPHTIKPWFDWNEVQKFYDEGHGVRECRKRFNICASQWYRARERGVIVTKDHRLPVEVLTSPERNRGRSHLKTRLLGAGILRNSCAECGISEWQSKRISLQLHHLNGVNSDNRVENLQLLCPNCHSQTENYSGRNAKKTKANENH